MGPHAAAQDALTKLRSRQGDAAAVAFYASIHTESYDPLRTEPRFQAIERALRFAD